MSNHAERNHRLTGNKVQILKTHSVAAMQLPAPGDKWVARDQPPELQDAMHRFLEYGIVESHERENETTKRRLMTTCHRSFEWCRNNHEHLQNVPGPCTHKGVRNLGDGEFTCLRDKCDVRFGRVIAEARL